MNEINEIFAITTGIFCSIIASTLLDGLCADSDCPPVR